MSYSHARRRKPGVGSFAFKSSAKAGDNGFPDRAVRPVLTAVTVATWCSHPTRPQIGDFFASFWGNQCATRNIKTAHAAVCRPVTTTMSCPNLHPRWERVSTGNESQMCQEQN